MKIGLPLLALLLSAAPLCAEVASVKPKSKLRTLVSKVTGGMTKAKAPPKAQVVKERAIPAPKPVAKSVPVSTRRTVPKAVPVKAVSVSARSTKPAPVRCPDCKPAAKSKSTASSKKSSSRTKTKEKAAPVIVPNHSEFIDISFPEPPGAKNSTREKPAAPVKKAEPVEEIPGVPSERPADPAETVVAKGR